MTERKLSNRSRLLRHKVIHTRVQIMQKVKYNDSRAVLVGSDAKTKEFISLQFRPFFIAFECGILHR